MAAIVEAVDLVVGSPSSAPLSLQVLPGEIVGLLFPPSKPRTPILRALAGLDASVSGEVRFPGRRRISLARSGPPLADALASQPDLVLLDAANDESDRSTWALLAGERARGTSFVVATALVDQACRGDRVTLASWEMEELTRAIQELALQMASEVQEFLAVLGEAHHRRNSSLAADLRRLNVGARALLAQARRCARDREERLACKAAAEQVSGVSVSDRVLDAVIVEEQDG